MVFYSRPSSRCVVQMCVWQSLWKQERRRSGRTRASHRSSETRPLPFDLQKTSRDWRPAPQLAEHCTQTQSIWSCSELTLQGYGHISRSCRVFCKGIKLCECFKTFKTHLVYCFQIFCNYFLRDVACFVFGSFLTRVCWSATSCQKHASM